MRGELHRLARLAQLALALGLTPVAALLPSACASQAEPPAPGHVVVTIDTDAPLPSSADPVAVGAFDALYLEVLGPDGQPACADCVREMALTREDVERGATFVVQSERESVLRVRLFSSRLGVVSLDDASILQRWVRLPAAPAAGPQHVTVALPLEQLGAAMGSFEEPTAAGARDERLPRPPAEESAAEARPGQVCVRGGWFWMGNPRLPPEGERSANVPRLVHVASFCVDDHEVTVAELRETGVATPDEVPRWSGNRSPSDRASFCAYTEAPGANDERAANCMGFTLARAACKARGMALPTEAQLEYLGTAFGRSPFVWGNDPPTCEDAVLGRTVAPLGGDASCTRDALHSILPATASELSATRDVLNAPGGPIYGLASNVAEWTRDAFEPRTAGCGIPKEGLVHDPECPPTAATKRISVRGASFTTTPLAAVAAVRAFVELPLLRADVGFRCVR